MPKDFGVFSKRGFLFLELELFALEPGAAATFLPEALGACVCDAISQSHSHGTSSVGVIEQREATTASC
jgi:hypothetical protein